MLVEHSLLQTRQGEIKETLMQSILNKHMSVTKKSRRKLYIDQGMWTEMIKFVVDEKGLKPDKVAKLIGCHPRTVKRMMNGTLSGTADQAGKLEEHFGNSLAVMRLEAHRPPRNASDQSKEIYRGCLNFLRRNWRTINAGMSMDVLRVWERVPQEDKNADL